VSTPPLIESGDVPAEARLPTKFGEFKIRVFHEVKTGLDHVALILGDMEGPDPVLVRVHSECLTGDSFSSLRCDCGPQLDAAMKTIQEFGWGVIVYLRQEGRGIGLKAKIQAYNLQDQGVDTMDANILLGHPADARDYRIVVDILKKIGVSRINLMTNNPDKVEQISKHGIIVEDRKSIIVGIGDENREYLLTKADKMRHEISEFDLSNN